MFLTIPEIRYTRNCVRYCERPACRIRPVKRSQIANRIVAASGLAALVLGAGAAQAQTDAEAGAAVAGPKGFQLKSVDGRWGLRFRGLIHADGRHYLGDEDLKTRDTFVLRRVRPNLEATFADLVDMKLMTDFGNGAATIFDAYIDLRPIPWLRLRGGKFKAPVGLERLQSPSAISFPERALPTILAPNRDVGFQLHGAHFAGAASYELGVFNGVIDGGSGDGDNNHGKDFVGRLFLQPWKGDPCSILSGLGVGVAASIGDQKGDPATFSGTPARRTAVSTPRLPTFRTAGQQPFFSYLVNDDVPGGTVIALGRRTRISPQGYYYVGPFGLMAEYIQSAQEVKLAEAVTLTHRAWQVTAHYVFGGTAAFAGTEVLQPFDLEQGTWGAVELAARINGLDVDDDAFPVYADPNRSATSALGVAGALTWHWSKNLKIVTTYEQTDFDGGAAAGADRKTERVFFERIQLAF